MPGPKQETLRSEQTIGVSEHQALEIVVWVEPRTNSTYLGVKVALFALLFT